MKPTMIGSLALIALLSQYGSGAQPQWTEPINQIEIEGGGKVLVEYGATPRAILTGSPANPSSVSVQGGVLRIICRRPCSEGGQTVVRATVPSLSAISIKAGGRVEVGRGFGRVQTLKVKIQAGGVIDAGSLSADSVDAEISAGGTAIVAAVENLHTRIRAGGAVRYFGNPRVSRQIEAGGSVQKIGLSASR